MERVMLMLASGFAERGIHVDLVLVKSSRDSVSSLPQNVRLVDLSVRRVIFSLPPLVRYLREQRPMAILSAPKHANVIALIAYKLARIPARLVVGEHNSPSQAIAHSKDRTMGVLHLLMRLTYPWAERVVAVSEGVANDLTQELCVPPHKIEVIYNPVVTDTLFAQAVQPVDHPWFKEAEPPVVLGVGRLAPQKDFTTLIRAFALVRHKLAARLMILGEGEERAMLQSLATSLGLGADDVTFPGFVENPFAFMRNASVFVLSSKWEGLGIVLIEAMAVGTPVVSTDCPSGPAEILENGRWGRLVPVNDPDALARAIEQTLLDPGPDPRERAMYFSAERAIDHYLRLLLPNSAAQL